MTLQPLRFVNASLTHFHGIFTRNSPEDIHKHLESFMLETDTKLVLDLMDQFIRTGGNPNLTFSNFSIGDNHYRNVTFFQLVYLYWKSPAETWSEEINACFEKFVDRMLCDERTDVRAKFTEHSLCDSEHFFNGKQAKYYRQNEEEGYLLEVATIAHYAMTIKDFEMLDKVLQKAPDLLHSTCCLMRGKNLLHQDVVLNVKSFVADKDCVYWSDSEFNGNLEMLLALDNDDVSGDIAAGTLDIRSGWISPVTRITKVSLMHLAARWGDEAACGYFRGQKANFVARDSSNSTPLDYLQLSIHEHFIPKPPNIKWLYKMLEPILRLNEPPLPKTGLLLTRDGYQLMYDTRVRVANYAYERLTKESLKKNSTRPESGTFKIDRDVPTLNRGKSEDYRNSGFDKGHLVPAANAVYSDKAMEDTFIFTNACPQHPQFNQQYWKRFEKAIRQLVDSNDLIEVFTGCLFVAQNNTVTYQTIGNGQTAVPTHLFKVLYLYKGLHKEKMAYIMPNCDIPSGTPFETYRVTVDKVQELSGILFNQWRTW